MNTGYLTTHILDTARGIPAANVAITLYRLDGSTRIRLCTTRSNSDGRTDQPILPPEQFRPDLYEIVFEIGDYFASTQPELDPFLDIIPVRFRINNPHAHYHVPLLAAPYGYSTYRGS